MVSESASSASSAFSSSSRVAEPDVHECLMQIDPIEIGSTRSTRPAVHPAALELGKGTDGRREPHVAVKEVALERALRAVLLTRTEAGTDVPLESPARVTAERQEAPVSKIDVLDGIPRLSMTVDILQARPILVVPQRLVDAGALGSGIGLRLRSAVRGAISGAVRAAARGAGQHAERAGHEESDERGLRSPRSLRERPRPAASDRHDGDLSPDQRERPERPRTPALSAEVLSRFRPLAEEQPLSRQLHEVEFLRARGDRHDP